MVKKTKDLEKKGFFSKLTKKQRILWCSVAIVILLIIVATSVTVPLVIINNSPTIPTPEINDFDKNIDTSIKVSWQKIYNAQSYTLEYWYNNDKNDVKVVDKITTLYYPIERQKGLLSFRLRANFKSYFGEFCAEQKLIIPPLILPSVEGLEFNDSEDEERATIKWNKVQYINNGVAKDIFAYEVKYKLDYLSNGESDADNSIVKTNIKYQDNTSYSVKHLFNDLIIDFDNWRDVVLTVNITALNYGVANLPSKVVLTTGKYKFLYNVYDESISTEAKFIITKEIYLDIKGNE